MKTKVVKKVKKVVKVTQKVIDEAISRREEISSVCRRCPIAIALNKSLKEEVSVGYVTAQGKDYRKIYYLPTKVGLVTHLSSYDWEDIKPFQFTIEI